MKTKCYITIEVEVNFTYDEGEPMGKYTPGADPCIEIDTVTVAADEDKVDILARLPKEAIAEIEDECWDALKT